MNLKCGSASTHDLWDFKSQFPRYDRGGQAYIGRDFKNDIAHKVNRKTCVICRSRYMEVLRSSPR